MLNRMAAAAVLFVVGGVMACQPETPQYPDRRPPEGVFRKTDQVAAGHRLFQQKCASCHGKPSEGRSERTLFFDPPAPDFTEAHFRQTDPAYLYWRIEVGKTVEPYLSQGSVMPAWQEHLSEEETWQLVAYLKRRSE